MIRKYGGNFLVTIVGQNVEYYGSKKLTWKSVRHDLNRNGEY